MSNLLEIIIFSFRMLIYAYILFKISLEYKKHKFTPLFYLILATIFLVIIEFVYLLPEPSESDYSNMLFQGSTVLLSLLSSLLLLLLFFDTFNQENVLTARNVILIVLMTTFGTSLLTSAVLITILVSENRDIDIEDADLTNSEISIFALMGGAMILSLFLVTVLIFLIFKTLRTKMRETSNPMVQNLIKKMILGSIIMLIGPLFMSIFSSVQIGSTGISLSDLLQPFVAIFGLVIIIYYFLKGGIYLFQGDYLRRLLIISESGIPIYSFSFRKLSIEKEVLADQLNDRTGQEILFSGALKSISYLLSEFTGSNKMVEDISLEGMMMMIKSISKDYSAVLMVDRSTKFFRNAINTFSELIKPLVEEVSAGQAFNTNQVKIANKLLESSFGFGYYQQIGSS